MTQEQKLRRIYQSGQQAFHEGRSESDNPHYHSRNGELSMWNKGYHDAQDNPNGDAEDYMTMIMGDPKDLEINQPGGYYGKNDPRSAADYWNGDAGECQ